MLTHCLSTQNTINYYDKNYCVQVVGPPVLFAIVYICLILTELHSSIISKRTIKSHKIPKIWPNYGQWYKDLPLYVFLSYTSLILNVI